jgi:hypothetical protein
MITLEFKTDDESLRELARQYWTTDETGQFFNSVEKLATAFGVAKSKVPSAVNSSCVAFTSSECCGACGRPSPFRSRTEFLERRRRAASPAPICDACVQARAEASNLEAENRDRVRREIISRRVEASWLSPDAIETFSLREALFLTAVARAGSSEDHAWIAPPESFAHPLSPTSSFDKQILDYLAERQLICVHPGTRADTIEIKNGQLHSWYPFRVHWLVPLRPGAMSIASFLERTEQRLRADTWSAGWKEEVSDLKAEIAIQECVDYLNMSMESHSFELKIGDKTIATLRVALQTFSVGQVFNFIWRAAKDAAAFYVRENAARQHAANIVPGNIQRSVERAIAEGWEVKSFRRRSDSVESVLSELLFTSVLKAPGGIIDTPAPARV